MARRQMDDVGAAPLGRQAGRDLLQAAVRPGLVLAFAEGMQRRAQHSVDQHVAGLAVERVAFRHPLLQLDVDVHAQRARRRGGQADEVRLHRPGDQDRIGAPGAGFAHVELQLADLVAAEGEARAVVPLHEETDISDPGLQVRHGLDGRRGVAKAHPGQIVESSESLLLALVHEEFPFRCLKAAPGSIRPEGWRRSR